MSQFFQIHPVNPQLRLIRQAVDIIRADGLVASAREVAAIRDAHGYHPCRRAGRLSD